MNPLIFYIFYPNQSFFRWLNLALRCFFRWDNFWVLKPQKKTVTSIRFLQKNQISFAHEINWKFAHPDCECFLRYWYSSLYKYTGVDRIVRQPLPKSFTYVSPVVSYIFFRARHIHSCNLIQSYIFLNIISTPFINLNWGCH